MSKELEALEKLNHTICLNSPVIKWGIDAYDYIDCKNEKEFAKCYQAIEKALIQKAKQDKILDILKKKVVNLNYLDDLQYQIQLDEQDNDRTLRAYNAVRLSKYQLTEEEYDLLKEWLK